MLILRLMILPVSDYCSALGLALVVHASGCLTHPLKLVNSVSHYALLRGHMSGKIIGIASREPVAKGHLLGHWRLFGERDDLKVVSSWSP